MLTSSLKVDLSLVAFLKKEKKKSLKECEKFAKLATAFYKRQVALKCVSNSNTKQTKNLLI